MRYLSTLVSPPTELPVTLEVFKRFARQSHNLDDSILPSILMAAMMELQAYLQFSFVRQTRLALIHGTPSKDIELDMGPVLEILSVRYFDSAGVLQTVSPSVYSLQGDTVVPSSAWPAGWVGGEEPQYRVEYAAGIVDTSLPGPDRVALDGRVSTAIMLLAQVSYDRNVKNADMLKARAYSMVDTMRLGQGV